MNVSSAVQRHRSLRWLVPAGVVAVAGLVATGVFRADASESTHLPQVTPAALLADVRAAPSSGFSGTVLSRVSLGLPDLPSLGIDTGDETTTMASLLSGSHTVQVWYGGADRQRIALLGAMDETDIFHYGRQIWTWNSSDRVAHHAVLPARPQGTATNPSASVMPTISPSALASQALAALSPTTQVQVQPGPQVADRNAYELVLTPRTSATRIGSVHISIDASTKLPLAVRVYARGAASPAIDVAYTTVRFTTPSKTNFTFSPPADATVRPLTVPTGLARLAVGTTHQVTGTGWTRIAELNTGRAVATSEGRLGQALTPVSGAWGRGGLLETDLVSVLVTSTGRVYAGAVDPSALYAAAGAK